MHDERSANHRTGKGKEVKTRAVAITAIASAALALAPSVPAQAQQSAEYHSAASCDELYIAIQSEQDIEWRVRFVTADGQTDPLWHTPVRQAEAGELSWTFEVSTDNYGSIIKLPDREYPSRFFAFDIHQVYFITEGRSVQDGEWIQVNTGNDTWTGPTDCQPDPDESDEDHGNCCYYDEEQAEAESTTANNNTKIESLMAWIQRLIDWINSIW